jgi:cytidylate kinase
MADKKIIIAIDGFSSSGKSSMAKQLAKTIGYAYIDSGAMYRAVTLYAMRKGISTPESLDESRLVAELPNIEIPKGDKNMPTPLLVSIQIPILNTQ